MIHVVLISILAYSIWYCIFNKLIKIWYFKRTEQETIKFSKKECSYVDSLHVSLIHASVCIILGFAGLIIYDNDIWRPMNRLEEIAIAQSFGYMIYDSILLYLLGELDLFVIWHHLGCITTILIFWLDGYGTWILMFNMSMGEITHPFHFTQIIFSMKKRAKRFKEIFN